MRHNKLMRTISLALCSVLLFSSCNILPSPNTTKEYFPVLNDTDRRIIPYAEMQYKRPDVEATKARLLELTAAIKNASCFDELVKQDDESSDLTSHFATMRALAMLANYHDTTDKYYEEEYRYCADAGVELGNLVNDLNRAIIEGPYAEEYRQKYGDYVFENIKNTLLLNSVAATPLKQRRNQLEIDYSSQIAALTLTQNGKEYTLNDIYAAGDYDLYMAYWAKNAPQFADIYIEMIKLDKEIAQKLGFESPAEMYYLGYSRDYTPADALRYCEESKEIFVPLAKQVNAYETYTIEADLNTIVEKMPKALAKVDPSLAETWNKMLEYGVYDFKAEPNKQSGTAFTTELYDYDSPFIYSYWENTFYNATTLMHEFGHFNDAWRHYDDTIVQNLDIAETYSQGLELLMNKHFNTLTKYPKEARAAHLQNFMSPLTHQAMLEEFQQQLYAMDTLDSDSIAALYGKLMQDYGLVDANYPMQDDKGRDYSWFDIPHLFQSPFYTISYWTSACVALQIWAISQEDYEQGVQVYANLLTADQNQPFTQLVTSAGLKDPGDPATLKEIANSFVGFFKLEPLSYNQAA